MTITHVGALEGVAHALCLKGPVAGVQYAIFRGTSRAGLGVVSYGRHQAVLPKRWTDILWRGLARVAFAPESFNCTLRCIVIRRWKSWKMARA